MPDILDDGSAYLPAAFYFKVVFGSSAAAAAAPMQADTSFKEVSGIGAEVSTEDVPEGGENRFVHKLPKGVTHGNLELKRGIASMTSPLVVWCRSVMEMDFMVPIVPQPLVVYLMDETGVPIRAWSFANAFPIKWEVEGFSSTKNEVAIEKIVLSYNYSNRLI